MSKKSKMYRENALSQREIRTRRLEKAREKIPSMSSLQNSPVNGAHHPISQKADDPASVFLPFVCITVQHGVKHGNVTIIQLWSL
jgi:hypothetical protein